MMAKIEEITDDNAKPSALGRLGTTDDWTITAWCDQCEVWHHYLAEKAPKRKSYDVWELNPHPEPSAAKDKPRKKKAAASKTAKDGTLDYFGRFKTVDEAAEKIEDELSDPDGDDEDDEDDDEDLDDEDE